MWATAVWRQWIQDGTQVRYGRKSESDALRRLRQFFVVVFFLFQNVFYEAHDFHSVLIPASALKCNFLVCVWRPGVEIVFVNIRCTSNTLNTQKYVVKHLLIPKISTRHMKSFIQNITCDMCLCRCLQVGGPVVVDGRTHVLFQQQVHPLHVGSHPAVGENTSMGTSFPAFLHL